MGKTKLEAIPHDPDAAKAAREKAEAEHNQASRKRAEELERTGGPIRPSSVFGCTTSEGLTIRDHFATSILPEILRQEEAVWDLQNDHCVQAQVAELAYQLADAMIEARKPVRK